MACILDRRGRFVFQGWCGPRLVHNRRWAGKGACGGYSTRSQWGSVGATQEGGLSRIKDGHVATLTTNNGLPCDTIHWSIEDDDHSLWLNTACGLVRIARTELDAWIADPKHRIETTLWDAADGVGLASTSPAYFNPPVAKSADGKLWFLGGEGVSVVDPHHLAFNKIPPPVHIERIIADHKSYWQNLPDQAVSHLRLPARVRDLTIDYSALSLAAPEKIHFKYKLEGAGQRLERGGQRPRSAVLEPASRLTTGFA